MTQSLTVGTSSGNKDATEIWVGTSSGNKQVTEGWVGTASGNQQFYALIPPLPPITATATPSSQTWTGSLGSYSTPGSFTVSASGGSGNYTYAWEQDGGVVPISIDSDTSASTGCTSITNDAASIRCLVSDDAGSTPVYSNSVSINP